MKILGIDTSCDETSAAIVEANLGDRTVKILSNVVASSLILHSKTGGIIPEVAAREQVKYIIPVIEKSLQESSLHPPPSKIYLPFSTFYRPEIDALAVTVGPGLIGSLLVGVETAKTLAYVWQKPIIPVNHLIGHIYANFISTFNSRLSTLNFPALSLIVSGGHTDLVLLQDHGKIKWLGGTRDDAAGEAFDKIGRLLGLPYPGGPSIEKASERGNPSRFNFPRPMIDSKDFDFSFSGLKTAVLNLVKKGKLPMSNRHSGEDPPVGGEDSRIQKRFWTSQNDTINNISASVQQAIVDVLATKTLKAAQKYKVKSILLSGGVAANQALRDRFKLEIGNWKLEIPLSVPTKRLCTDNGAMVASAAFFNYKPIHWSKITANPELYFDNYTVFS